MLTTTKGFCLGSGKERRSGICLNRAVFHWDFWMLPFGKLCGIVLAVRL